MSSKKRKARDTEQQTGKKKKKKKQQQKKKNEEEEQSKPRDAAAASSSSRDQAALKLGRKKKKPKMFGEKGEERSDGVFASIEQVCEAKKQGDTAAHLPCNLKEHNQAQEDGTYHVHVDHNAVFDRTKRARKKVRFSDQFATCKCRQSQLEEVHGHNNSVFKEPTENGCGDQAYSTAPCSCNKDNSKEAPAQDESMNSNAGQARKAIDEKTLSTRKRPKDEDDVVWGKWFTPEEDELLKNAILEYVKVKGWNEKEGIDKVLNCRQHKEAHNCWGVIRLCLPHRPRVSIRSRAFKLLEEGTHLGRWSKEEEELLKRLYYEHGNRWKYLSTLIGRSQSSVKNKWGFLKRPKPTGVWAWDEMQQLSDLVHKDLWLKAVSGMKDEKSGHRFLRDNIKWDQLADAIGTHSHVSCCIKWYCNLSSPMVIDGLWATEDDCLLLKSLLETGACTEEEVDWHKLLRHRSGQTCLVRWKQMGKYLGENRTRAFLDKLDSLVRRYAPDLLSHER